MEQRPATWGRVLQTSPESTGVLAAPALWSKYMARKCAQKSDKNNDEEHDEQHGSPTITATDAGAQNSELVQKESKGGRSRNAHSA